MEGSLIRILKFLLVFILVSPLVIQLLPDHAFAKANSKVYLIGLKKSQKTAIRSIQSSSIMQVSSKIMAAQLTEAEAEVMSSDPNVAFIEEDVTTELQEIGVHSEQEMSWGFQDIGAARTIAKKYQGNNVKIAILDTGIAAHPDLKISGGVSYIEDEQDYEDYHGHGTAMAGIIAAQDNQFGVVGIAPKADIFAVKVLDQKGHGTYSGMIQGIEWAIQNEMNIISISAGGMINSQALHDQIKRASEKGILVISAAGNKGMGEETEVYPALYPETISVGAVDKDHQRANFSSVGSELDLSAPGVDILSTSINGEYKKRSGTSLAVPHVAGAAAVIWSENSGLASDDVRNTLLESATTLGEEQLFGKGLVNVAKAMKLDEEEDSPIDHLEADISSVSLYVEETFQLAVTAVMKDGTSIDITTEANYSIENEDIAKANANGNIIGLKSGNSTITVKYAGKVLEVPVQVKEKVSLTPKGSMETPEVGELVGRLLEVKGWYLDPVGVSQVSVLLDGTQVGTAQYGMIRPDIQEQYPEYQDGHAGFRLQFDTSSMETGSHSLSVQITNQEGSVLELDQRMVYFGGDTENSILQTNVSSVELAIGDSQQLVITAVQSDGTHLEVTQQADYEPEHSSVVEVTEEGLVTGVGVGRTVLKVSYEGTFIFIPVMISPNQSLKPVGQLEVPTEGENIQGIYNVKGWYLDPAGVSKVEVFVDDKLHGLASYGVPRPDVMEKYPDYQNTNAGFEYALDSSLLTDGTHILSVIATNVTGTQTLVAERQIVKKAILPVNSLLANVEKIEISKGNTKQLSISYIQSDLQRVDVTSEATYVVEDPLIASVTSSGIVSGLQIGKTSVTVSYQGESIFLPIDITEAARLAQGGIDTPLHNAIISGTYPVTGWFVDSTGVDQIEILLDGTIIGQAQYGLSRPEIEITDQSVAPSDIGFVFQLDTTLYPEGAHTISVRETGHDGLQTMLEPRTVQITPMLPITDLTADTPTLSMAEGQEHQLTIKALLPDQTMQDLTKQVLYSSDNAEIASVSADGLIKARIPGNTNVIITYGDKSLLIPITVTEAGVLLPKGELETPVHNGSIEGIYRMEGWFLHTSEVRTIQLFVDDVSMGEAIYGNDRPDIALQYPAYQNENAGFYYLLDTSLLTSGSHVVRAVITDAEGKIQELDEKSFVVEQLPEVLSLESNQPTFQLIKGEFVKATITATLQGNRTIDVSADANYTVSDTSVVYVNPTGSVLGLAPGQTIITINYGGQTITVPVVVGDVAPTTAIGEIDFPIEDSESGGVTTINGWILDPAGVKQVEVLVNKVRKGIATYGEPRPEISNRYADYRDVNPGFQFMLDTASLAEGVHQLEIREIGNDGKENLVLTRNVKVGSVTEFTLNPATIEVFPDKPILPQVIANLRDGTSKDVSKEASYTILDPSVAKMDENGMVSGLKTGTTILTVSYSGIIHTYTIVAKMEGLVSMGEIETPQDKEILSGKYLISGWFLPENGVDKVEILIDGEILGEAKYGLQRFDILRQYPNYPDEKVGFSYQLDAAQLPFETHQLAVLVTEIGGKQTLLERSFESVASIRDQYLYWLNFSGEQERDNWEYAEMKDDKLSKLEWDDDSRVWLSEESNSSIGNTWMRTDGSDPVIRWTAPRTGNIHLGGTIEKIEIESGDGVNLRVMKNDTQIWPISGWQTLEFNDAIGLEIDQLLEVEEGDQITFQINARDDAESDLVKWLPEISYLRNEVKDNVAPHLFVDIPDSNMLISSENGRSVIHLSGFAMDPNMGDQVQIWAQIGDQTQHEFFRFTANDIPSEFSFQTSLEGLDPETVYSLKIWAVDSKANKSEVTSISFHPRIENAEIVDYELSPQWNSPAYGTPFQVGTKIPIKWSYSTTKNYYTYIESQKFKISYRPDGGGAGKTLINTKLAGTDRTYTFDSSVVPANATITVYIEPVMTKSAPAVVIPLETSSSFFVQVTNQGPIIQSTEFTTTDNGRTGKITYEVQEKDVGDKLAQIKIQVGTTPGGTELGEDTIPIEVVEGSQGTYRKDYYKFPITKDLLNSTIYWTVRAQDNRGAWTDPTTSSFSIRLVDALPKIVIFTPVANHVIDINESFTLDGTYSRVNVGDNITMEVNRGSGYKTYTANSTSGFWTNTVSGNAIGEGTYSAIDLKLNSNVIQTYGGSVTVVKKPGMPSIKSWDATTNSIRIIWTAGANAVDYGVSVDGGSIKRLGNVSEYTITGLQPNRAYAIQLYGYNSTGIASAPASVTVQTKPAESNFTTINENSPIRTNFSSGVPKYFKVIASSTAPYQLTLNNDSGLPGNAMIKVFRTSELLPEDMIGSGSGVTSAAFVSSKAYYIKIEPSSSFYGTLLVKPGNDIIQFNQPRELTIQSGQTVELRMDVATAGNYRMVVALKNSSDSYPEVNVYANGKLTAYTTKPTPGEWQYELATGTYSIKLTNKQSTAIQFTFTVYAPSGGAIYEYIYDQNNRLLSIKENGVVSVTYTYDENGNILRSVKQAATQQPKATALTVDLDRFEIPAGESKSVKVTATLESGSTVDVTTETVYLVENPSVATVSSGRIYAVNGGTTKIALSYGGQSKSITVIVEKPSVTLRSITLSPTSVSLSEGQIQRLYVTAQYSDGSTREVNNGVAFSSSNPSIADVDSQGIVTGVSSGIATITASLNGKSASSQVQVIGAEIKEIKISPSQVSLEVGSNLQVYVVANYSNGVTEDITGRADFTFAQPSIAVVNQSGLITANAPGTTQLNVTYNGMGTHIPVVVTGKTLSLQSIAVDPADITVSAGSTQQLQVYATYSDGSVQTVTAQATYQIAASSVATVASNGLVTAVAAGSTTVTVLFEGKSRSVPVTVSATEAKVESIAIDPASMSVSVGASQQLTVTATYNDGSTRNVTGSVLYENTQPEIVSVSNDGLITGISSGTTTVLATFGDKTASINITVVSQALILKALAVDPSNIIVKVGQTQSVIVTAEYENANSSDVTNQVQYQMVDTAIAKVGTNGSVTGITAGETTLLISLNGTSISVPVTVSSTSQIQELRVNPQNLSLMKSGTQQLNVLARFSDGSEQDVTSLSVYQIEDSSIATVDQSGVILGLKEGVTSVSVQYLGQNITVPVQVKGITSEANRLSAGGNHTLLVKEDGTVWAWGLNEKGQLGEGTVNSSVVPIQSALINSVKQLQYDPAMVLLTISQSKNLKITAVLTDDSILDVSNEAEYESSNPEVVLVNSAGVMTGVSTGNTKIRVAYKNTTIQVPVQVLPTAGRLNRISVGAAHSTLIKDDQSVWGWGANDHNQLDNEIMEIKTIPEKISKHSEMQLVVNPSFVHLVPSQIKVLQVNATVNDEQVDVTALSTFETSDPTIATVNDQGVITAKAVGNATVTIGYKENTLQLPVEIRLMATQSEKLAAGGGHSILIRGDGTAWTWGANEKNQLGEGTTNDSPTPIVSKLETSLKLLTSYPNMIKLSTSQRFPLKIMGTYGNGSTKDVTVESTFNSLNSEIAMVEANGVISGVSVGTTQIQVSYKNQNILVPIEVKLIGNKRNTLSAGGSHSVFINEDGTIWTWGANEKNQLGDGTLTNNTFPTQN